MVKQWRARAGCRHCQDGCLQWSLHGHGGVCEPGRLGDFDLHFGEHRRLARDAGVSGGADIAFDSSLPQASGMSSSSAMVIATYLALASANDLDVNARWQRALPDANGVAGYLGAVENGKAFGPFAADNGVGTHGGSEDQTAILCSKAGLLSQYRFIPVALERSVPLPPEWTFAVAMSGAFDLVEQHGDFAIDAPFDETPESWRMISVLRKR